MFAPVVLLLLGLALVWLTLHAWESGTSLTVIIIAWCIGVVAGGGAFLLMLRRQKAGS
jgi:hypothetical protein